MTETVLITGASNGIGLELAKLAAAEKNNLVLVARSEGKLNELAQALTSQHGIKVDVIAADLAQVGAAQALFEKTESLGLKIDILVNNAGFGGHGKFYERELAKDEAMMQLNMATLTSLTHLYLQGMVQRNRGKVLNVASTAGFMPGPLQAVYYATKAYVNSFSQAVAEELSDTNITVTALCPGAVATGFVAAGDLEGVEAFDKAASAESVARVGWQGMKKGELISFNDRSLKFLINWVIPFLSRKRVLKMSRQFMEKSA